MEDGKDLPDGRDFQTHPLDQRETGGKTRKVLEWEPHLIHVLLGPAPEGPKAVALATLTHKA